MNNLTVIPEELDPITVQLDNIEINNTIDNMIIELVDGQYTITQAQADFIVAHPEKSIIKKSTSQTNFAYYYFYKKFKDYSNKFVYQYLPVDNGAMTIYPYDEWSEIEPIIDLTQNGFYIYPELLSWMDAPSSTGIKIDHTAFRAGTDSESFGLTTTHKYQTTAPTAANTDGGIHIVYLQAEPATKYDGYIYMIAES